MAISETKMQMVIANYFKNECNINMSLKQAFEKGFHIGVKKGANLNKPQKWTLCSERMPKENEWIGTKKFGTTISDKVLVTFEAQGKRFVKPMTFQNGKLGSLDKQTMDTFYKVWRMVAWMPLPEPYTDDISQMEGSDE